MGDQHLDSHDETCVPWAPAQHGPFCEATTHDEAPDGSTARHEMTGSAACARTPWSTGRPTDSRRKRLKPSGAYSRRPCSRAVRRGNDCLQWAPCDATREHLLLSPRACITAGAVRHRGGRARPRAQFTGQGLRSLHRRQHGSEWCVPPKAAALTARSGRSAARPDRTCRATACAGRRDPPDAAGRARDTSG
jgi:hypothetical protein